MRVLIVGGVAGGASTAARLRRMDESAEIVVFERGPFVSFANCGLPYHISGTIPQRDQLLVTTPADLKASLNIDARPNHEVLAIDRAARTVWVRNQQDGSESTEPYDKLVLSPGAVPIVPPLPGVDATGVFQLHNIPELDAILEWLNNRQVERAVVVGGGFIGLEVAENLVERGVKVSLVEMLPQVLAPIDGDMASMVHEHLALHGVELVLGDGLKAIAPREGSLEVQTSSGKAIPAQMVVLAIGVRPDTSLAREAGLDLGPRGHIIVNDQMQTSDPDIYAVGDAILVKNMISGQSMPLALAGPASREGRTAADNIAGFERRFPGVQGTSVVKVFDLTVASTGLNSRQLQDLGLPFKSVITHNNNHAGYYPGAASIALKLLYSPEGKIYGAQAVGGNGADKRIDVIATAMRGQLSVYDLEDLELCYAPPFGSSRDPVNIAGFTAANELRGDAPTLQWADVAGLDRESWLCLDVRQPEELAVGQVPEALNIPLGELRGRHMELPRDKKLLVNCAGGQRSYYAVRALRQLGYDAWNLSGGYKTYHAATQALPESGNAMDVRTMPEPVNMRKIVSPAAAAGQTYHLDACGLQCPGPILRVYKQMDGMQEGDEVVVSATDFGFANDIAAWARSTGNTLKTLETQDGKIVATLRKGLEGSAQAKTDSAGTAKKDLTMVVFSGDLDKAIAAFIIANGFASMGQKATLFFTFWGLNMLRRDQAVPVKKNLIEKMFGFMMPRGANKLKLSQMHMLGAGTGMIKGIMTQKHVDSLPELIRQAQANGVRLIACQMTMDLMGIRQEELIEGVELGGVATMAESATESNTHYFI